MSVAPPGKLDGWKAIATYLGRNERTAQRWAHERSMPVHHVPGGRSGAVFAYEAEIDAWLQADKPLLPDPTTDGNGVAPPAQAPSLAYPETVAIDVQASGRSRPRRRSWRRVGAGAVIVATVLVGGLVAMLRFREPPTIFRLQGNEAAFDALDPQGRVLWRFEARAPESRQDGARATIERTALVDLDSDGHPEVLVFAHYVHEGARTLAHDPRAPDLSSATAFAGSALWCLTPWGNVRWTFDPNLTLSFAGRRFDGPWRLGASVAHLVNGQRRLWVSLTDAVWWPSLVLALDADGRSEIRYVSAGHVYALAHLDLGTTPIVLAGGVNNEYAGASLAALDAGGAATASPQTSSSAYYCDECPPGRPIRYFVFPRSEVNRLAGDPYNRTEQIQTSDSQVLVSVFEGSFEGAAVRSVYGLSRALDIESVGMSGRYWEAHRRFERDGRIAHTVEQCEEYTKGLPVRTWTSSTGWTTVWARQVERAASSRR